MKAKRKLTLAQQRKRWRVHQKAYMAAHPEQTAKKIQRAKLRRLKRKAEAAAHDAKH